MSGWAAHELGHCIAYVARHPDLVPWCDVYQDGDAAQVQPRVLCDPSELGLTPLVNFAAGSIGERVHAGELEAIERLMATNTDWLRAVFDTPHFSEHDWQCFRTIIAGTPALPVEEFAQELVIAERLIERYLPYVDVDAFQTKLERDGRFRFGVHNLKRTLH